MVYVAVVIGLLVAVFLIWLVFFARGSVSHVVYGREPIKLFKRPHA